MEPEPEPDHSATPAAALDLGHGVSVVFTSHAGHARAGLIERHPCPCGGRATGSDPGSDPGDPQGRCAGSVLFELPGMREAFPNRELWRVYSLDPLTLDPSLQCRCRGCTHHGFIYDGRWVPA